MEQVNEIDIEKKKSLETLFKQLNAAIKIQRVYSQNHPMCIDAAVELFKSVESYFQTYPKLSFNVSKESLLVDGYEFSEKQGSFYVALSDYLHERQITTINIDSQVKQHDLEVFLSNICNDAEEIRQRGGIEKLLSDAGIVSIEARRLEVETGDEIPDEVDLYGEAGLNDQEIFMALNEGDLSNTNRDRLVIKLRKGSTDTTRLLLKLSDMASSTTGESGLESRADYLANTIAKLGELVKDTSKKEREEIFNNLAGGLSELREDLQSPLLKHLNETLGSLDFGPELLGVLNKAVEELDVPMGSEVQDIQLRETEDIELAPEEVYFEFAHLYDETKIDVEETIKEEKEKLEQTDIEEQAIDTLIEMLNNSQDIERLRKALGGLDIQLGSLIDEQRFDLTAKTIQAVMNKLDSSIDKFPTFIPVLEESITKAARPDNMRKILTTALQGEDKEKQKLARASLDLFGETAVSSLMEILSVEQDDLQRIKICKIAAHQADNDVTIFKEKLVDPKWEVVKSVVIAISSIPDDRVIELFNMTMTHSNPEIREATVIALSNRQTPKSVRLLMTAIGDMDPSIQIRAVSSLGKLKAGDSVSKLIDIVTKRDMFQKQTNLKLAAINALGDIGSPKAMQTLKKIAKKRAIIFRKPVSELRKEADGAISKIKEAEETESQSG